MNIPFNARELENALNALKDKKSPGPDKITNKMLKHMGPKAKSKLIGLYNNSWKVGLSYRSGEKLLWCPSTTKAKNAQRQPATVLSA